jgi:eukaryotic-like serine/threonine-protein kinase
MREDLWNHAFVTALQPFADIATPQKALLDAAAELAVRSFDYAVAVIALAGRNRVEPPMLHGVAGYVGVSSQAGLYATATRAGEACLAGEAGIDPRTLANPVVARALGFGFRVDLPLRSALGDHLGMLTLLDRSSRRIDDALLGVMQALADGIVDVLEVRLGQRIAQSAVISVE